MDGAVYIFENLEAQRVKVGVTGNLISDRLAAINDLWLGRKVTCQICGGRLNSVGGYVPHHPRVGLHAGVGFNCYGGNALPSEMDTTLTAAYLDEISKQHEQLSGTEKSAATKFIKTLKKRIDLYRNYVRPNEAWQYRVGFYTQNAGQVELLSHKILADRLDSTAPFGEVFSCSALEAEAAVTEALSQLGLLSSARRETVFSV